MLNELDGTEPCTTTREIGVEELGRVLKASDQPASDGAVLELARLSMQDAMVKLEEADASNFQGIDASMLDGTLDASSIGRLFQACSDLHRGEGGALLSLAHNDLSTGTNCEQRVFDLLSEKVVREAEQAFHEKKRSDSSKEKDFAAAASMKRKAQEGIDVATSRLRAIEEELASLEEQKTKALWNVAFTCLNDMPVRTVRYLNLSDCCLHATSLERLLQVLLYTEHYGGEGERVRWLDLSGNDLGDPGMAPIARFLKLTGRMEVLILRNVSLTERGISEAVAGLVLNKTLRHLDLRDNGLANSEAAQAALKGVQRFNKAVNVSLS